MLGGLWLTGAAASPSSSVKTCHPTVFYLFATERCHFKVSRIILKSIFLFNQRTQGNFPYTTGDSLMVGVNWAEPGRKLTTIC